jgi:serralysin
MRSVKICIVAIFLAVFSAQRLFAAFHLWAVSELYSSPDGSVQFIQLTNNSILEAQLGGHVITCAGPQGTNVFTFPTNLPSTATANKSFLIGTPNLPGIPGGVVPDYVFTNSAPFLFRSGGSQIIVGIGGSFALPAAYTNLPSDGSSALVGISSNLSTAINSAKNFNGQSNSIVPVKFSSAKVVGTNFVVTFPTATGINGAAGTNYTVDFKNLLTDPAWTPVATVAGDGTTKSVTNVISGAPQRVYRLRAP